MSLLGWLEPAMHRLYGERKRALFSTLHGRVLEIGAGTGLNRLYLPAGVEWLPLEPEVAHHRSILSRQSDAAILTASAEAIPLSDESMDAVISSLVLCSVGRPDRVLQEILRVLKPGGCLLFLEHVAAPRGTLLARLQTLVQPIWTWLSGGCHPDRDTGRLLRQAGFARVEWEELRLPVPIVSPHLIGRAFKGSPSRPPSG